MIRSATTKDLDQLAELAGEFHSEATLPAKLDKVVWKRSWGNLMDIGAAVILVKQEGSQIVGTIGCVVYPDMNSGEWTADEAFWFQTKGNRGGGLALLKAMERSLDELGVKRLFMIHLECLNGRLGRIYERMGYTKVETRYVKDL
jgi:N-acetylglutamate synthase-like GNAT family acetyltransferase